MQEIYLDLTKGKSLSAKLQVSSCGYAHPVASVSPVDSCSE